MPEQAMQAKPTNLQALQYLFDLARTAPASAPVHEQAKVYALQLNELVNADAKNRPIIAVDPSVAEAVSQTVS